MKKHWDKRYRSEDPSIIPPPSPALLEEVSKLPPGDALDLAAGSGRNSYHLAEMGWKVRAVDFSEEGVRIGKSRTKKLGDHVSWLQTDLKSYLPEKAAFDLVYITYLHLPKGELKAIFERAAQALRPGGRLLILGHHRDNLKEGNGGPKDPELLYTGEEIVAILPPSVKIIRKERRTSLSDHGSSRGKGSQIDCIVSAVSAKPSPL